jgi:hypothetical protein
MSVWVCPVNRFNEPEKIRKTIRRKQKYQEHSKCDEDIPQTRIENADMPDGEKFLPKLLKHRSKIPDLTDENEDSLNGGII